MFCLAPCPSCHIITIEHSRPFPVRRMLPMLCVPLVCRDPRIRRWRICPVMTDLLLRGALSSYMIAYREHPGQC